MARRRRKAKPVTVAAAIPTIEVRNPAYQPGHPEEIERVVVTRSRADALNRLHVAGRIDDCGYAAARHMQQLYEAAEVRGPRSVDLTQDPVDGGGRVPQIMTDRQLTALKTLNRLYAILGKAGTALVHAVIRDGLLPEQYARALGMFSRRDLDAMGRMLRWHLEVLAGEFGYAKRA